jgi:hypothetical protein
LVVGALVCVTAALPPAPGQDEAAALSQYNAMHARLRPTADSHWRLALWCAEHGLKAEAEFHFGEVVRLDPKREAAWRKMGFKKINGRWRSDAQISAEKAEHEANKVWGPRLKQLHDALHHSRTHADALAQLATVDAAAAVPSVWNVFGRGGAGDQLIAVQLLGQIRSSASTQLLAILAGLAPSSTVAARATETLRQRDPEDYAPGLVALIRKPLRYEVRPVAGPGSTGLLFVEGERVDLRRAYSAPPPELKELHGSSTLLIPPSPILEEAHVIDVFLAEARRSPVALLASQMIIQAVWQENQLEAARAAAATREQMANDVAAIESINALIRQANERITMILRTTVGGTARTAPTRRDDPAAWTAWLETRMGRTVTATRRSQGRPKMTVDQFVPLAYVPSYAVVLHLYPK